MKFFGNLFNVDYHFISWLAMDASCTFTVNTIIFQQESFIVIGHFYYA